MTREEASAKYPALMAYIAERNKLEASKRVV